MATWNPWHGCVKYSEGCANCYVYRMDRRYERDSSAVHRNSDFDLPLKKSRDGSYKLKSGETVYTCFTSDFFLDIADEWRREAWRMMKLRCDLRFFFITKRIERFYECVPPDWGDGYDNVAIALTVENQKRANERLPIYMAAPIKHKSLACEPLLERVDLSRWLTPAIDVVVAGGESGEEARVCDYEWILSIRDDCRAANVPFVFKQTGARFLKDGRLYRIPRAQQHPQARRAGIDTILP